MAVQQQLDAVLSAVGQGVLVLDSDFRVVRLNAAGHRLLDMPMALAEPGVPARDLVWHCAERGDFGPGDPAELTAEFLALLTLREPQAFEHHRPDRRLLTVRSQPVAGGGVVLAYSDETDFRHAVDDLHAANSTLERSVGDHAQTIARLSAAVEAVNGRVEEAVRDKARTLDLVNHALRAAAGSLHAPARALLAGPLGPVERGHVGDLLRSLDSLRLILDDLGDLVRLESDEIRLLDSPFTVETVVGSALTALGEQAEERDITLLAEIDPAVPATVVGDAAWLRHVLVELVGRAVRDNHAVDITLRVTPAGLPDGRQGLRFAVGDAGPDAAEELRAWLTQGVPPLDGALRRQGWRGLGLHICRRLVGLMGGEIGEEPGPDGTRVLWCTAALPALAEEPAAVAERPPLTILVVEDNPVNQRVNAWLLRKDGHRVAVVGDGREAVDLAARGGFDAVLMDLDIPGLDGIAATRAIRALPAPQGAVPIIAITSSALPDDIERCRAAGMDDHLPKPVNPAALARVLDRLTGPASGAAAAGDGAGGAAGDGTDGMEGGFDGGVLGALEAVIGRGKVLELVGDFLAHARDVEGQLAMARDLMDPTIFGAVTGELKTMAGTVGLTGVYQSAVALERAVRNGDEEAIDAQAALLARQMAAGVERLRGQWAQ
ncbi:PAS-domain containing protein [Azospirillum rugosum]|uniref:CheY-like chemotaxis protein/signal transduction histidine kinase n=1 Tax=Azospirillum rugosum TaxID=416170 RepID=A0ABS4SQ37_9PROT|nr:PAS-domain containing protein [Azospirillum rugosum]MBP2294218.1 CheY-like chemotaxis protein/signal transduction histidine kinase [Azospirillum rugosum]MDQ0527393.1 CheY-like chemotaxis protein/signal transduction histidine kinase [Azospirillum rugosum]